MKILAIESATHACSVALSVAGEVSQRFTQAPRRHGELILPWIDELLATAGCVRQQLDGVALSRGPGSFTSLRLGLSVGTAIAFALDIPVYPVSTLAALAWRGYKTHGRRHILSLLDARMGEVYAAAYTIEQQHLHVTTNECLLSLQKDVNQLGLPTIPWFGVGNGFALQGIDWPHWTGCSISGTDADCWPDAAAIIALADVADAVAADHFSPVYLRDKVADPPRRASI